LQSNPSPSPHPTHAHQPQSPTVLRPCP
jgi:hypothetical protein